MQTLLCAFDDHDTGRRAMTRLIEAGFPRDDLHLQPEPAFYAAVDPAGGPEKRPPEAGPARLLRWLADAVVGPPVPGACGTYRDAIRRRSTVVVVHVASDDDADRAIALMTSFGAFDIERRLDRPKRRGPLNAA